MGRFEVVARYDDCIRRYFCCDDDILGALIAIGTEKAFVRAMRNSGLSAWLTSSEEIAEFIISKREVADTIRELSHEDDCS